MQTSNGALAFRRKVVALTVAAMVVITGCAGSTPSNSGDPAATDAAASPTADSGASQTPVTVTIWGWWPERMAIFEEAAADFMAENPAITIKVEVYGDDLWPKVYASVPAGTGPTLLKMLTTDYFQLRDEGLLIEMPADIFPQDYLVESYPTHNWEAYGRYVYPEGIQPAILTYNKAMFTEAGLDPEAPPASWDEFFAAADALTIRNDSGTITRAGVQFDDWLPTLNTLFQQGGSLVTRNGDALSANFNTPENATAFQFFLDAMSTHEVWDPAFPYYSDAIGNEQAAMSVGESWVYGTWKSDFPDTFADLGFAAPPTPTGDSSPYYGRKNSVLGLASMANRPDEETAAGIKFLEYLVKERLDTQLQLSQISGLVPARAELLADPAVTGDPFLMLGAELAESQYDAVDVPDVLNDLIADTMTRILQGDLTIEEALELGQTELQSLIDAGDIRYLY